jgi:hypothetical protein
VVRGRREETVMDELDTTRGGRLRVPRTRGAVSGLMLVLLGAWGALIPFIGPYFTFGYTPDTTWAWTTGRFWFEVLPGIVAGLGGLLILFSANRVTGVFGAWAATAAGAWFVVGSLFAPVLSLGSNGTPIGNSTTSHAWAATAYFFGLGAAIIFFAALALGRLTVVGVRDVRAARARVERADADRAAAAAAATPAAAEAPTGAETAAAAETPTAAAEAERAEAEPERRGAADTGVVHGTERQEWTDAEGRRWETDAQGQRWTTDAEGRRWTTDAEGHWRAEGT